MRSRELLMRRKLLIALPCLVLFALYVRAILMPYLASRLGARSDIASLERAVQLDPSNANYYYDVGRYHAFVRQDFSSAIAAYKSAVALNPHNPRYWLDLATAYQVRGDMAESTKALDNAIRVDPTTPDVVWQAANFDLIQGNTNHALRQFRAILERDPDSLDRILDASWRATRNPEVIVDEALPPRPQVYLRFLWALAMMKHPYAPTLWSRLVALNQPLPTKESLRYVDYLIADRQIRQAREAWQQLIRLNPALRRYESSPNLMVNGGFEEEILNQGFDWHYEGRTGVKVAIDVSEPHTGTRALAISFEGSPSDAGLYQLTPVEPNTRYRFSVQVKAEDVEGINGPQLALNDVINGYSYVLTDPVLGSTPWTEKTSEFTTGRDTTALIFRVLRAPTQRLIRGKILIDDLSLTPIE